MANGVVYIGPTRQGVRAERRHRAGVELHHRRLIDSSPAVANGVVYFGSVDDNVYALNAATGAEQWTYTIGDAVDSSPAVANGVVYTGSGDGNVYAFGLKKGQE